MCRTGLSVGKINDKKNKNNSKEKWNRKKKINNEQIATIQMKSRVPVKRKRTYFVWNAEINKTDRFSDDRFSLESNYRLLEMFHFTHIVLL